MTTAPTTQPAPDNGGRDAREVLRMRGITMVFPGVRALDDVDFTVRAGEIHALMGQNGAGKSTLIKVLTGVYRANGGSTELMGHSIAPKSPAQSEAMGISTVYQEVNLVPTLSVAENLLLGRQPSSAGILRWGALRKHAREAVARLGLDLDVNRPLAAYSVAIQQMVAIARALDADAKLLVLDEPTSSLDEAEVGELFAVMRRLRDDGLGIVFVTHFLDQVYAVADRITVLRNGGLVMERPADELPRMELVAAMLGRSEATEKPPPPPVQKQKVESGDAFVEAEQTGRRGTLHPLDLTVRRGETLGLAGLLGSGRTETARMLFGIDPASSGHIRVENESIRLRSPRDAIRRGFAYLSEDRKAEGIVPGLSVRENIILAMQAYRGALRRLTPSEQEHLADHYIRALQITPPNPGLPAGQLSGGNQQKVLIARWLAMQPTFVMFDEPTRGIDIGAKSEVERITADLRAKGTAVLFISSEIEEMVRNCQRVAVLRDRRKVGELNGPEITPDGIMHLIAEGEAT